MSDSTISEINIMQDFSVPDNFGQGLTDITSTGGGNNTSGNAAYIYLNKANISRKLLINGNGHTIDFGAVCICFSGNSASASNPWDITWSNLKTFHGNWYGFTTLRDMGSSSESVSKLTYDNITDVGNQVIHSEYGNIFISGNFKSNQTEKYTSMFRTDFAINATDQTNFYASKLTIQDNSNVDISTINAGNIDLGYNFAGDFTIGNNVTFTATANGTKKTGYEARGANILLSRGSVIIGNDSKVNLIPQSDSSSIALVASNTQFYIGKNSVVDINSTNHTSSANGLYNNLIYLYNGSTLNVNELGTLNITATGMQNSDSHIIQVDGKAEFTVEKLGTFDVKSDSSSPKQNLLYFGSNQSKFQFADAKKINLERTTSINDNTGNNGLINIAGSGGILDLDIQKVNMWSKNDFGTTPTESWSPMYGVQISFNNMTSSVLSASSLTTKNEESFKNSVSGFSTKNVQRVSFDYIPDVNISFVSIADDNHDSNNSTTITGITNPGAYVRLSDVPLDSGVAVIDPSKNAIKSPVTSSGQGEEVTSNFTVQADSSGKFTFTIPEGKYFSAGSTIKAYSFLEGKNANVEQIVLDKTPPKGESVDYQVVLNESTPTPDKFVKNPVDSNPKSQNFTYTFNKETPQETVDSFMSQLGEHIVKIDLFDEAGNLTIITSTLTVNEKSAMVSGDDFDAHYVDIRNLSETELKDYIIQNSKSDAFKLANGIKTDLTQFVTVTDFGGLNNVSELQPKAYPVTLTVKAADSGLPTDITTTIQVTVVDVDAVLSVEFLNEANQVLPGYTVKLDTQVGDTIDLTKEESVTTQLTNLTKAGYDIAERPADETAVKINNTALTVQYKLQGVLSLTSVPSALDFGSLAYNATTKRVEDPEFDKQLVVTDTRADAANGWRLTATLTTSMKNDSGQELVNALRYVTDGKETILNTNAQVIYTNSKGTAGSFDVSDSWGKTANTDGIKLQINSSDTVYTGDYVGVITWKVMAGQP
ncbi:WxL domain-containing protein [Enterococcus plantarum]|nr:pectate lyase-like adhesive domain-containing protein [Enterococcus plantarum]MBO0422751.1 WxL domain-containing protein [Enterococcus plantarum]